MKRLIILSMLLALLAVNFPGADPALAYYPPLQDITGPTVVQDTETKVNVSVHDPATGQDIPGVWSIPGGVGDIAIDQIFKNQGMVAWRVQDLINNKYQIVTGVYDPNPEMGWQFSTNWGEWLGIETKILAVNDGVVLYEAKYTPAAPSVEDPSVIIDYFATYDPAQEMPDMPWIVGWRSFSHSFTDYSGGNTFGHVVKDGVVAYIYNSPFWDYVLIYSIYDSRLHGWWTADDNPDLPSLPSITNATLAWTDSGSPQKRGYDYTSGSWLSDVDTKVMANFVFAPIAPRPDQVRSFGIRA